jgi:protein-L-isoaspartate(D-aspartate) O-methyltransferase
MADIDIVRRAYAKQIMAAAGVESRALEEAFARVPREDFLGPGPWQIWRFGRGYCATPSADPVYLYTNDLVAIDPARQINNGEPSFHATLMAALTPAAGEHVVHIGTGTGYYTAILAELVRAAGRVTGIEYDPSLSDRAARNLARYPNITVLTGDGARMAFDPADGIYVNAGATRPIEGWLDGLTEGGRLILPLTTDDNRPKAEMPGGTRRGGVLKVVRYGSRYAARFISSVMIFPCAGARDAASERLLAAAMEGGGADTVRSLRRDAHDRERSCWLHADGWCLSQRAVDL